MNNSHDDSDNVMLRRFLSFAYYAALFLVCFFVFSSRGQAMFVQRAVCDAMSAGSGWGRDVLAGCWEYPQLSTIILLLLKWPASVLHTDVCVLYVSLLQAWVIWQFSMLCGWKRCWFVLLPSFVPLLMTRCLQVQDGGWLGAALFTSGACALVRWKKSKELHELVTGGVTFGLMALCGPLPAVIGLAGTVWLWVSSRPGEGYRTLVFSVWGYCVFLFVLWNWLVLGNPFFFIGRAFEQFGNVSFSLMASKFRSLDTAYMLALFFPVAPLCIMVSKSNMRSAASYAIFCLVLLGLGIPLALAVGVPCSGAASFTVTLLLFMCALASRAEYQKQVSRNASFAAVCLSLAYSFIAFPPPGKEYRDFPARQEITEYIDVLWPESRIMLYGAVLPAYYSDPEEKRFTARFRYSEKELLEQAEDELMHLLLPPPELGMIPAEAELEDIYHNGRPWLFLEKKLAGGWKLWRVISRSAAEAAGADEKN